MLLDSQDTSAPIDTPIADATLTARDEQINRVVAATQLKKQWFAMYIERCSILAEVPNEFKVDGNIVNHFWALTRKDIETHGIPKLAALCKVAESIDLDLNDVLKFNEDTSYDNAMSKLMYAVNHAIYNLADPLDDILSQLTGDAIEDAIKDSSSAPIELSWNEGGEQHTSYLTTREIK